MTNHNNPSPQNVPILHTSHLVFLATTTNIMGWEVKTIQILQLDKIVGNFFLMTNGPNYNASNLLRNSSFLISCNIINMLGTKV
jgi:hypothetical protein